MEYRMHRENRDNAGIPWIRASDINKKSYDIRAPVQPLYCENAGDTKYRRCSRMIRRWFTNVGEYRAAALIFLYGVMYIALLYIAGVITYQLYLFI